MNLEQADTKIHDLPTEILVMIFEYLNLHELVSTTSQTSMRWRGTISSFAVRPKLLNLAKTNLMFKRDIEGKGWTEKCVDIGLVLTY